MSTFHLSVSHYIYSCIFVTTILAIFPGCALRKTAQKSAKNIGQTTQQTSQEIFEARLFDTPYTPIIPGTLQERTEKSAKTPAIDFLYCSKSTITNWFHAICAEAERLGWHIWASYLNPENAHIILQKPNKKIILYARLKGEPKKVARTSLQNIVEVNTVLL